MMLGYVIGLLGVWILSDAVYSYTLYVNAPSYDGVKKQTWKQDHWVRAIRAGIAIALVVIGGLIQR